MSRRMMEELEREFPKETPNGLAHREAVLVELGEVITAWMTKAGVEAGMSEHDAHLASTKTLVTLGSYRLGVVHPGSDIDTLCIGPPHISREDFFSSFVERLNNHEQITECVPIPDAYTPIVKLKMREVYLDLLFARLVRPLGQTEDLEEVV